MKLSAKTIHRRCPHCRGAYIRWRAKYQSWICRNCTRVFLTPIMGRGRSEQQKSGVIAGRIEHGRGSVWGAGIV